MSNTNPLATAVAPVAANLVSSAPAPSITTGHRWYAIKQKDASNEAEIFIYDEIGAYGITAKAFVEELKGIEAERITLRINTPGGEVFDATAIYNALSEHPAYITAQIDGLAASAGSYIALSGDEVKMADNAYMMIHNAMGGVMGEAEDMRRYADQLEDINNNLADIYQRKAGNTKDHWLGLMAEETWFTAEEAKAAGLVDEVYTAAKKTAATARNKFDLKIYNKVPDEVRAKWGVQNPQSQATQEQQSAPAEPQRSVPPPQATTQESLPMATDSTVSTAVPAQTPAAGPIAANVQQGDPRERERSELKAQTDAAHFQNGRLTGQEEGRKTEMNRLDAILAVCPDKAMALDAFRAGQSADAVRLAYDAKTAAENRALEAAAEKDMEIARLKAQIAIGGHPGGIETDFAASDDDGMPQMEPKAQAEREWEQKPGVRKGFSKKENYVAFRTRELTGRVQLQSASR